MKRLACLFLALLLLVAPCLAEESVRVAALKGPTAMGMVGMMRDCADRYSFTLAASADEIVPAIAQGTIDIAAIPANLAAALYNNTSGSVRVLAINTLGVLYIVERGDSIHSVADLRGRTIVSAGKGATPEYALNSILIGAGLDPLSDVTIEYKSEHAECLAALINDPSLVAMLPQPFVTIAQSKADDLRVVLDLNAEWDAMQQNAETPSALITGVAIARASFIEEHPEAVQTFLSDYAESVDFVLNNTADAASLIGEFDIFDAAVAEKALPQCNITLITSDDMRAMLGGYLADLFSQNPESVGGALPDDAFYYVG